MKEQIGILGVGQCGGNIVSLFEQKGYECAYVNTSMEDLNSLKNAKYKIVTLIGSTKFKDDFIKVKEQLTLQGFIVLSLGVFSQYDNIKLSEDQLNMLADIQNKKIEMADEIFVINKNGYIGDSTKTEIEFAKSLGKKINYLE